MASTSNDSSIKFYEIQDLLRERAGYTPVEEDYTPNQTLLAQRMDKKKEDRDELEEEEEEEEDESEDEEDEEKIRKRKTCVRNYEMKSNTFFDGL